eukprot:2724058-Pyramimonas_sp.AAC.1
MDEFKAGASGGGRNILKAEFMDIQKLSNPRPDASAEELQAISKQLEQGQTKKFHKSLTLLSTGVDVQPMALTVAAALL